MSCHVTADWSTTILDAYGVSAKLFWSPPDHRAHRFGGCSPAHRGDALLSTRSDPRRSTTGTIAMLRPLGRELARAEQLPPPRPLAPKPPHPPSSCANVTRSRFSFCKNEKNEDSEKTGSCHLPPGLGTSCMRARAAATLSYISSIHMQPLLLAMAGRQHAGRLSHRRARARARALGGGHGQPEPGATARAAHLRTR